MYRRPPPAPERDSIYGDTYNGVPTPNTVVEHGYPTRYHGPVFTTPQPGYTFRVRPYARAPFVGVDGYPGHHRVHLSAMGQEGEEPPSGPISTRQLVVSPPEDEPTSPELTKALLVGAAVLISILIVSR